MSQRIDSLCRQVEDALLLFHPELRTAVLSDQDRVKLAACIRVLVEEIVDEKLSKRK